MQLTFTLPTQARYSFASRHCVTRPLVVLLICCFKHELYQIIKHRSDSSTDRALASHDTELVTRASSCCI